MPVHSTSTMYLAQITSLRHRAALVMVSLALVGAGCAGDAAVAPPPATDVTQLYWALTLDHHAVTLSTVPPYDTIRLTAVPRNVAAEPLSGSPAAAFISTDLERVQVSPDGLVHALRVGSRIAVVATMTLGGITHADTVVIAVTDTAAPPLLAALSLQPDSGDSAKVALGVNRVLVARATNAGGQPLNGLAVHYASSDRTTATIDRSTGRIRSIRPGPVTFVATATAYGITRADTLPFTIGLPVSFVVNVTTQPGVGSGVVHGFGPNRIVTGVGGIITWRNWTGTPIDVTFADPTNVAADPTGFHCFIGAPCDAGNIAPFGVLDPDDPVDWATLVRNGTRSRRFPVPGTYPFHSTLFGTTGTIIVVDEHAP